MRSTTHRRTLVMAFAFWAAAVPCVLAGGTAFGADATASVEQMRDLAIEDLLAIDVVSVSKKSEPYSRAAAAVYVLTRDEIRRSGATSLPEALRLVPGLHVARIDATWFAVTARGFNSLFANKLLVMVDGRSVYTSLFSGVYWEALRIPLDSIERIEVIRGPGGAVWGANAVNGVINIITRSSDDTQGLAVDAVAGTSSPESGLDVRYGGRAGALTYRITGTRVVRESFDHDPRLVDNGLADSRGGVRADWARGRDTAMASAEAYGVKERAWSRVVTEFPPTSTAGIGDARNRGHNMLARFTHETAGGSTLQAQVYYDHYARNFGFIDEKATTVDADLQQALSPAAGHEVVWGLGVRRVRSSLRESMTISTAHPVRRYELWNLFGQDEISFAGGRYRLTLGTKLEHHDRTGLEILPSVRFAHERTPTSTIWVAASRAVRTPSRYDSEVRLYIDVLPTEPLPTVVEVNGSGNVDVEKVVSFEAGARGRLGSVGTIDVTGYYNRYDDLVGVRFLSTGVEFGPTGPVGVAKAGFGNGPGARSYGAEVSADIPCRRVCSFRLAYTYHKARMDGTQEETGYAQIMDPKAAPKNQLVARASFALSSRIDVDAVARTVGSFVRPRSLISNMMDRGDIPSYTELDLHVGWKVRDNVILRVVGQDLLHEQHVEFGDYSFGRNPAAPRRRAYAGLTWTF